MGDDAVVVKRKIEAHKILWRKYGLQEAINRVGFETIVKAIDVQYVAQLHKEYLGFSGVTIFQMLNHLCTWYNITNAHQLAIKIHFVALWGETPDTHANTYAWQLDKRQAKCADLKVVITDDNKTLHFIGQMYAADVFDRNFLDDWEDAVVNDWAAIVAHFKVEFDKIGRARERAAERAEGVYSSAAALTQPAQPPPTPDPALAYTAMSEYVAELELNVDKLQTMVSDQSVLTTPSEISTATEIAAAATTTTNSDLAEIKALAKSLAKANALQQQQLMAALVQLSTLDTSTGRVGGGAANGGGGGATKGGGGGRGTRRGKPREKHSCVNCKRLVWHSDPKCMELKENAHLRYKGWKGCLM